MLVDVAITSIVNHVKSLVSISYFASNFLIVSLLFNELGTIKKVIRLSIEERKKDNENCSEDELELPLLMNL